MAFLPKLNCQASQKYTLRSTLNQEHYDYQVFVEDRNDPLIKDIVQSSGCEHVYFYSPAGINDETDKTTRELILFFKDDNTIPPNTFQKFSHLAYEFE